MPKHVMSKLVPTAIKHKPEILERLSNGETVASIAKSLGIARETLSRTLAHDADYQQAFTEALDARLDQREQELEQASDNITLARARELLSHARWRAERLNPARYGQRPSVAIQVNTGSAITDAELAKIVREGG